MSCAPVLRFYDTSLPTTLQVDASKDGLGACLMQQGQPVAYTSRALSNSEMNYAPIENEMLTIVLGCERFNMYTHGAEVNSDHKPLKTIFKKPLFKVPPRLQRIRLRFQKYYIKVKFVQGKFQYIADTLSRACNESSMPSDSDMHKDMEYFIHSVVSCLPISDVKLKELRDLNSNDPTMQMLHQYSLQDWPALKCDAHPSLKSFWDVRNDTHVTDGILLKDNRLVIPSPWKKDIL